MQKKFESEILVTFTFKKSGVFTHGLTVHIGLYVNANPALFKVNQSQIISGGGLCTDRLNDAL